MAKMDKKSAMSVFSVDVAQSFQLSSDSKALMGKKTFSFQLLPIRAKRTNKLSKSLSQINDIHEDCELESVQTMLPDDTSSSSDDEQEFAHVNCSFEAEVNSNAKLFKTFGKHRKAGGNLKDGTDIHHLEHGKCVVADLLNCRLVIFSKSGKHNVILQNKDIVEPWGLAFHENLILVTSRRKRCVVKISQTGDIEESSFGESTFRDPCGIGVTNDHRIIVSDIQMKKVSVHEWCGKWLSDLCQPDHRKFQLPRYITVSPTGDMIISDSGNHCIYMYSENGTFKKTFGSFGSNDRQLKAPYGVCCDPFGNIFVADHYNDRVSLYTKDGDFIKHVLTKEDGIFHPQGISFSGDMKLFVTHGSLRACEVKVFRFIHVDKSTTIWHV